MDFREFSKQYNNYLAHNFSCTGTKEDFLMHYGVKGMKWHDHRYAQDPDAKREHNTDIYDRTKIDKQIKVAMQKLEDAGDFDDAENMEGIIREKQEELRSFDPTDPRDAAKIKAYKDLIAALIEKRNQKFGKGENKLYGTTYARRWR